MSRTLSMSQVGASYWSYMAGVMATWCQGMSESKQLSAHDVPERVYQDASRLFDLIQDVPAGRLEGRLRSLHAYVLAANVVRGSSPKRVENTMELNEKLKSYALFLKRLPEVSVLTEADVATARELARFFRKLEEEGESEAYSGRVRFEGVPAGLRFR